MGVSSASAVWNGTLKEGNGTMKLGSEPNEFPFTFASRFEDGKETNPEELIGAAHAGCFVQTHSTYPSQIIGGPASSQVRMSPTPVLSSGDGVDVLVALNQYA